MSSVSPACRKRRLNGAVCDELFLPYDTFIRSNLTYLFLTNHICNTLLHVLKTFESIMPLRRHIPKRRPKMTCPLKHRSQPGIPRDLKQFYMYYLWEASNVANYLKLWALFAVLYSPSERTGRSPSSVVCCFSAFYIIYILYIEKDIFNRFIFIWQQSEKNIVAIFVNFETLASVKFED